MAEATVIAVLGAESTGKSTLALALAGSAGRRGPARGAVGEVLREFCDAQGRTPHQHEQAGIAAEQTRAHRRRGASARHRRRRHHRAADRRVQRDACSATAACTTRRCARRRAAATRCCARSTCPGWPTACSATARRCASRWTRCCVRRCSATRRAMRWSPARARTRLAAALARAAARRSDMARRPTSHAGIGCASAAATPTASATCCRGG